LPQPAARDARTTVIMAAHAAVANILLRLGNIIISLFTEPVHTRTNIA
jgi:hypothetical protein